MEDTKTKPKQSDLSAQRLDKVESALLLIVNSLRNVEVIDGKKVVVEIPEALLDRVEKLLLHR